MIYKMKLLENEFNNIKFNGKTLEVRLNDDKRRRIKRGDWIIFYKLPHLDENILVNVEQVFIFSSFSEVYTRFPKECFGYRDIGMNDIIKNIYTIYTEEEEKEKGVMAIKFRLEGDIH